MDIQFCKTRALESISSPSVYGKVHESLNFAKLQMENLFVNPVVIKLDIKKYWAVSKKLQ